MASEQGREQLMTKPHSLAAGLRALEAADELDRNVFVPRDVLARLVDDLDDHVARCEEVSDNLATAFQRPEFVGTRILEIIDTARARLNGEDQ